MGFTHVEILPVMEHPFYASWGYQTTWLLRADQPLRRRPRTSWSSSTSCISTRSASSSTGCPSHFPSDEHGLAYFDGTHLYEHADPRQGFHPDWGSLIFNYGRNEVRSFLLCQRAVLARPLPRRRPARRRRRVDALPRLFAPRRRVDPEPLRRPREHRRDRLPAPAQHRPCTARNRRCRRSPRNRPHGRWCRARRTSAGSASASSGTWAGCTTCCSTCRMTRCTAGSITTTLTFRMIYAFTENFVLPLSHDEVVHGKGSLLDKMAGDDWQKFANLRLLLAHQYTQPGKKLLFMGGEFGQRARMAARPQPRLAPAAVRAASGHAALGARPQPALPQRAVPARTRPSVVGLRMDRLQRFRSEHHQLSAPRAAPRTTR